VRIKGSPATSFDTEGFEDFEVSPDLYTHLIILRAVESIHKGIESGNIENGYLGLTISVDQLEQILTARNMLKEDNDYWEEVKNKEKEIELLPEKIRNVRLANFKLGRLMRISFRSITRKEVFTI
jgi:hypothetical protein